MSSMSVQNQGNNYDKQNNGNSFTNKAKKIAGEIGNAFLDGAVSIAKDTAKDKGKRIAEQAINELAGSLFNQK